MFEEKRRATGGAGGSLSILIVPREKWRTNRGSHRVGKGDVGLRKLWMGNTIRADAEPKMDVPTKQLQIATERNPGLKNRMP